MTTFRKYAFMLASVLAMAPSWSWDGTQVGTVTQIDVTDGNNFGIRVYLSSGVYMCAGSTAYWGYLNSTDSNYNAYVATIMTAKATGARLTVWTTNVNGYCHIGYLQMA